MSSPQPVERYRTLFFSLLLVVAVAASIISSCGGGGSGPDGGLCSQCGTSDGPCQSTGFIVPGANQPVPCPTAPAPGPTCVERPLICRRKSNSAQQRCFPAASDDPQSDVDFFFRCDGSRPGGTLVPATVTPTTGGTPTPASTPVCGNGIAEAGEQCDGADLRGETCDDLCIGAGGTLTCNGDCTLNFSGCAGFNCTAP